MMEYEIGVRLQAILENQEKQFTIEQYKINLLEAMAKKVGVKLSEVRKDGELQSNE